MPLAEGVSLRTPPSQNKTGCPTEQEVTASREVIAVGDRVEISDCPGHWSWASPFTVEGISGEMVKLEMVGELVELKRLSLSV